MDYSCAILPSAKRFKFSVLYVCLFVREQDTTETTSQVLNLEKRKKEFVCGVDSSTIWPFIKYLSG